MAYINPIFTSSSSEQVWADQISKTLEKELAIEIDVPLCIFEVPKTKTAEKPEAYAPKRIGLGPNHHFRPELYKMEQHKLEAVKRVLKPHQFLDFQRLVLDKVRELVPAVRSCYDIYLDADDHTLAWVFAIDGLFLLDLFNTYPDNRGTLNGIGPSRVKGGSVSSTSDELHLMSSKRDWIGPSRLVGRPSLMMEEEQMVADSLGEESATYAMMTEEQIIVDSVGGEGSAQNVTKQNIGFVRMGSDGIIHEEEIMVENQHVVDSVGGEGSAQNATEQNIGIVRMGSDGIIHEEIMAENQHIVDSVGEGSAQNVMEENIDFLNWKSDGIVHDVAEEITAKKQHIDDSEGRELARDVMMAETQIPFIVLKEIQKGLNPQPPGDSVAHDILLYSMFRRFCEAHSPLKLSVYPYPSIHTLETSIPDQTRFLFDTSCVHQLDPEYLQLIQFAFKTNASGVHLLDFMYQLIVNNQAPPSILYERSNWVEIKATTNAILNFCPAANPIVQLISFILNLPWDKIVDLYRKWFPSDGGKPAVEKIVIPSTSDLCNIAKIKFSLTPDDGGIRDIKFDEKKHKIFLPAITLNIDSEVILRNLVAYEALTAKPDSFLELAEYVDLMCGIIYTAKDVTLLRDEKIIQGDLSDDEIAKLFNGISKSSGRKTKEKSKLQSIVEKVNEIFDDIPKVKAYRFLKKQFYASWKFFLLLFTIINILLLILQGYCTVYGCSKLFGHNSPISSDPLQRPVLFSHMKLKPPHHMARLQIL